jgi:hypothetical protein
MEMDMQEPVDMYCWEEHQPENMGRKLKKITGLHEPANHIVISYRSISYSF